MGVSGAAFKLHFHQPNWCPSSAEPGTGFDCTKIAMKALGYKTELHFSSEDEPSAVKKARQAIVQSINNGFPAVAIDLVHSEDWGVIVGYQGDGKEFLCRTYFDKTEEYSRAEKWPWIVVVIKEKGKTPDRRESLLRSLEIAVKLGNTEKFGNYASGFAAYEKWVSDLLDEPRFEKLSAEGLYDVAHINGYCYNSLVDARDAAVRYLRSIGEEFGTESALHLSRAADLYKEIAGRLKDGRSYAPTSWQLKDGEHWTKEMRHAQSGVLGEVVPLEREAVDQLGTALELAHRTL
jgi:hypothetical protein